MSDFLRSAWYPAGWSRDIGDAPVSRRILNEDIVLYRKSDGAVVALEDVCPHRLLPLSFGKRKGDALECGYHGATFDASGRCIRIPGQELIPANARVRAYPVAERMGLAWIWMGAADRADPSTIYDLPQYHDPEWMAVEGDALPVAANYLSLADNLCDPSHVSFVHLSTLGNAQSEDVPVQWEMSEPEKKILTWRWIIDAPAIPLFQKFGGFAGPVDRWHYYHYHAPNIAVIDFGSAPTGTGAPEGRRDNGVQIYACHFMTPVDEAHSIDHWQFVANFKADEATRQSMIENFRMAFAEDKLILERIEANEQRMPERRPLRFAMDASPVRMRRMVADMIAAERSVGHQAA
ncbi:MAG: aromatic ring-hydroxylating dioxygenase subunit alpha [Hyphomicrobiales bacterium]|nr:aromatic ring-hydroxylating dioxygenase subunit alpha [Hyphomicrobiales bacterium]